MASYTYRVGQVSVGGVQYGSVSVLEEMAERLRVLDITAGHPPAEANQTIYGDDCQYLTQVGAEAIRGVRRLMKHGPLNNTMLDGKFAFGEPSGSDSGKILANSLNVAVEAYWELLKSRQPKTVSPNLWAAAALAAAGRAIAGGVCSTVSYVTLGVLTQTAHDIIACLVYDSAADHSYVLIRRRHTSWFVVDPWVRSPRLCPWKFNYFGRSSGNHTYVYITEPTTDALGVTLSDELHQQAYAAASKKGLLVPFNRKIWGQDTNAARDYCSVYPPVAGPEEWGSDVNPNFSVATLWA